MWLAMWTTRTSATSSHTERRRRNKPPSLSRSLPSAHTQYSTQHLLHSLFSDAVAPSHTLAPSARSVRLPAHYEKTCLLFSRYSVRGLKAVWLFVCEYQQVNMGLFSIKRNNLVAPKLSLHLCPRLLFLLLFLPSLILSFCIEANSACTMPMYSAYAYAVQCIQRPVRHISWVLWCMHSPLT